MFYLWSFLIYLLSFVNSIYFFTQLCFFLLYKLPILLFFCLIYPFLLIFCCNWLRSLRFVVVVFNPHFLIYTYCCRFWWNELLNCTQCSHIIIILHMLCEFHLILYYRQFHLIILSRKPWDVRWNRFIKDLFIWRGKHKIHLLNSWQWWMMQSIQILVTRSNVIIILYSQLLNTSPFTLHTCTFAIICLWRVALICISLNPINLLAAAVKSLPSKWYKTLLIVLCSILMNNAIWAKLSSLILCHLSSGRKFYKPIMWLII